MLCGKMEVLNTLIPNNPKFLTTTTNFCIPIGVNKRRNGFLKLSPYPSLITYLPLCQSRSLQVSAHFNRPSNRRSNSLRKKLIDDKKVRETPLFTDPDRNLSHNLDDNGIKDSNLNVSVGENESKFKLLGESVVSSKLESWVDQYKKDVEFWGIGTSPIFTVFRDSDGNVKMVDVDEDEILRRNGGGDELEGLTNGNLKILHAKKLAKQMESGENVISNNSTVAKFFNAGEERTGFVDRIQGVIGRPDFFPKLSRVGIAMLCGVCLFWVVKSVFSSGKKDAELTRLEKEMLRRKLKSRMEKEELERGSVEVMQSSSEQPMGFIERPKLDKLELMNNISVVKASNGKLALQDISWGDMPVDFNDRILEIRKMAREARVMEEKDSSLPESLKEENQNVDEECSNSMVNIDQQMEAEITSKNDLMRGNIDGSIDSTSSFDSKTADTNEVVLVQNDEKKIPFSSSGELLDDKLRTSKDGPIELLDTGEMNQDSFSPQSQACQPEESSSRTKPKVIRSVKEAREYLSRKHNKQKPNQELVRSTDKDVIVSIPSTDGESVSEESERMKNDDKISAPSILGVTQNIMPTEIVTEDSTSKVKEFRSTKIGGLDDANNGYDRCHIKTPRNSEHEGDENSNSVTDPPLLKYNWMEKNFHEFEPVVQKIGAGFKDNYMVAREKANTELNLSPDLSQLGTDENDGELEWMKDDHLSDIVFRVRDNELAGREPFYMINEKEKATFFEGLEKKVEKENKKLLKVHEYLHSNIENLDYGADGISMFDPLEKIVPRWKSPPLDKNPEFLNNLPEQQNTVVAANTNTSYDEMDELDSVQKSVDFPSHDNNPTNSRVYDAKTDVRDRTSKKPKTVIEGSDGSVRVGQKSGKEFWQHTKKWSRGFIDSYSAETDPEAKSVMKDIGKDLDRWITEKEIQEAAELMDKMPERNKKFIEKKLAKLKREMELFGPQAVVSKYREYAEEKGEDPLWWLDLPFVLCIELYTKENEEQKIGFYSLEMALDLELEPKPYHVIAFEDSNDCKNMCYIIQAHMEMLGYGLAFVVARPPKDAFREAKANGFSVTVIRKGELQLNVGQPLEEVEEQITEIGSKIYHDQIMKERSVDTSALMKGVFGFGANKPTKSKRLKRKLKKPRKARKDT